MTDRDREEAAATAARDQIEAAFTAFQAQVERGHRLTRTGLKWALIGVAVVALGILVRLGFGMPRLEALLILAGLGLSMVGMVYSLAAGRPPGSPHPFRQHGPRG